MTIDKQTLRITGDPTPWVVVRQQDSTQEWCVLWLQGWMSTIDGHLDGIKRMSQKSGLDFAMLDYAGHGSHPVALEDSTREQQFTEVSAAYRKLVDLGYKNIFVIGGSFGGYMAALLAENHNPRGIILRAPAIYNDNEFSLLHSQTARWDDDYDHDKAFRLSVTKDSRLDALEAIRNYNGPVYIMEHQLDSVVPRNIPIAYFEAAKQGNYIVVPKTEHSPKLMPNPQVHFDYIEHLNVSLIKTIILEEELA